MTNFKQDKGKGTSPISTLFHHPATAGWGGNNGTFSGVKVWYSSFSPRGQFLEAGPFLEPTDLAAKMGQNSTPVKSWVSEQKTGERKRSIMLQKPGN